MFLYLVRIPGGRPGPALLDMTKDSVIASGDTAADDEGRWLFSREVHLSAEVTLEAGESVGLVACSLHPAARPYSLSISMRCGSDHSILDELSVRRAHIHDSQPGLAKARVTFEAGAGGHRSSGSWQSNPQLAVHIRAPVRLAMDATLCVGQRWQQVRIMLLPAPGGGGPVAAVPSDRALTCATTLPKDEEGRWVVQRRYVLDWTREEVPPGEYVLVLQKTSAQYAGNLHVAVWAAAGDGGAAAASGALVELAPLQGPATVGSDVFQAPAPAATAEWRGLTLPGRWSSLTAGGRPHTPAWRRNPMFGIVVHPDAEITGNSSAAGAGGGGASGGESVAVRAVLRNVGATSAPDAGALPPLALHVLRGRPGDGVPVMRPRVFDAGLVVGTSIQERPVAPRGDQPVQCEGEVRLGSAARSAQLVVVPCTWTADQVGTFELTVGVCRGATIADVTLLEPPEGGAEDGGDGEDSSWAKAMGADAGAIMEHLRETLKFPEGSVPIPFTSVLTDRQLLEAYASQGRQYAGRARPEYPVALMARACAEMGTRFVDREFPPLTNSLVLDPAVTRRIDASALEWRRPDEVFSGTPQLFIDGTTTSDVVQGSLGNCYLVAAIASMASRLGSRLQDLFRPQGTSPEGIYSVRLFVGGEPVEVVVDDYLPVWSDSGRLAFSRSPQEGELWVPILEKAFAKLHGCYEALVGGWGNMGVDGVLRALGGASHWRLEWARDGSGADLDDVEEQLWQQLNASEEDGRLVGTASRWKFPAGRQRKAGEEGGRGEDDNDDDDETGLVSNHTYTVLGVMTDPGTGTRVMQLRNAWGRGEWKGAFSDADARARALFAAQAHDETDDGVFWMSVADFVRNFNAVHTATFLPLHAVATAVGVWTEEAAGGGRESATFPNNPQYLLRFQPVEGAESPEGDEKLDVRVEVHRMRADCVFGVAAFSGPSPVTAWDEGRLLGWAGEETAATGVLAARASKAFRMELSYPATECVIVPFTQWRAAVDGEFTLRVAYQVCGGQDAAKRAEAAAASAAPIGQEGPELRRLVSDATETVDVTLERMRGPGSGGLSDVPRTGDDGPPRIPSAVPLRAMLASAAGAAACGVEHRDGETGTGAGVWPESFLAGFAADGSRRVRVALAMVTDSDGPDPPHSCMRLMGPRLRDSPLCQFELTDIGPEDVRAGKLTKANYDVLFMPGGMAPRHARLYRSEGLERIREFVAAGGAYLGICAGCFLAHARVSSDPTVPHMLRLIRAAPKDNGHWKRGFGDVTVRLNPMGRALLGSDLPVVQRMRYANGPLLVPLSPEKAILGSDPATDVCFPIASFATELNENGAPLGLMTGSFAGWACEFGEKRGRVVTLAPHPEYTRSATATVFLQRLFFWAAGGRGGPDVWRVGAP